MAAGDDGGAGATAAAAGAGAMRFGKLRSELSGGNGGT